MVIISEAPPVRGQRPGNGGWVLSRVFLLMFIPSRVNTKISPAGLGAKKRQAKYLGLADNNRAGWKGAVGVQTCPCSPEGNKMVLPF